MSDIDNPHTPKPGAGWLGALRSSPRSYPEDFPGENGNYISRCHNCYRLFMGHKRRFFCKQCITPKRMRFNPFNYFHTGALAAGFLALAFVDVLIKEYTIGRGPIVDSLSIMSPGGKAAALLFLVAFAWTILFLPIRSIILKNKHGNRLNRK